MKLNLAGLNRQTKIFRFGMLAAVIAAPGISVSQSFNFSVRHLMTPAVAGIIAAVVRQHQLTVRGTQAKYLLQLSGCVDCQTSSRNV